MSAGRDQPLLRMIPAYQGLESADLVARQIDHRLIVEFELAGRQRLAQILLHDAAGLHLQVHRRLEEAEGAAAIAFRPVQRKVRIAQQPVGLKPSPGPTAMPMLAPITA